MSFMQCTRAGLVVLRRGGWLVATCVAAGCTTHGTLSNESAIAGSDGPTDQGVRAPIPMGDVSLGREVFRFETFGNERFWTDAVRLPAGMAEKKVTPIQALELGVMIDVDAIEPQMRQTLEAQLRSDPSGRSSAILNDPAVTAQLVHADAVIGMPAKGDKAGASCALCHTITDASMFELPNGGSIGHRLDGRSNHNLNLGKIFATAANSRALYPMLQLSLAANKGKTLGRAPTGLTENSSEADVDAYLSNPAYYPVGTFDDTYDGNGNQMHLMPLFRQDLSAPYGSGGTIFKLENFSNLAYTSLMEPTTITTPAGRAFLHLLAGAAGDELADDYVKVLAETGVTGYPYVQAASHPGPVGNEDAPVGLRVDEAKLRALNAYMVSLQAPPGAQVAGDVVARGRQTFRTAGCMSCHNVNQGRPVPATIHAMAQVFPGDSPVILAQRTPPLSPIMNTDSSTIDDKASVLNASVRGEKRGLAMPLLLDLARKPVFLHDNSVPNLNDLFDPHRGPRAAHPFYITDARQRADLVDYLRSLGMNSR
jgi:cytochrome c2